jgi:PAS domain-containing protein
MLASNRETGEGRRMGATYLTGGQVARQRNISRRTQADHLALVLRSLPYGLVAVDASGQITLINEAAMRLGGGAGASDAGPHPGSGTLHARVSALLARALAGEPAPLADSTVLAPDADAPRMVRMRATTLTDSAGAINGATALLFDDDERAGARAAAPIAYAAGQAQANRALARSNSSSSSQ